MLAREILNKKEEQGKNKVHTIIMDKSVFDAISMLHELKIGSLLVINSSEEVIGIVSEKDILYKCYNSDIPLKEQRIEKLMTSRDDLIIGKIDDDSQYLRNVMTEKRIRHIPIIEEPDKLVGIISIGDVIKAELESTESETKLLREHIKNPFGIHIYKTE